MKKVKDIYKAYYEPIADLVTYRAMPTQHVPMNLLDPFLLLNHHGRQQYAPHNKGLPFGPHPHRGFETVTFILEGDLTHKDSSGAASVIRAGGVQWMTAGSGLIHNEISSPDFKTHGGPLEILQLWVNLPARLKMTAPHYVGLQKEDIPEVHWDGGQVRAQLISGTWHGVSGAFTPLTDIHLATLYFKENGQITFDIPADKNIFFYVVKGSVTVNTVHTPMHHLVHFDKTGTSIHIKSEHNAIVLLGHATPFNEPFVAHGPFVMNTREEIMQAYDDYQKGRMGDAGATLMQVA